MKAMTIFPAQVADQQNNAHYPDPHTETTAADPEPVARLDHVVAEYVSGRRSAGSFVTSNCLVMEVDNSHTENQADWVTPASLAERPEDQQGHHPPQRRQPHHQVHLGRAADPPSICPLPGRLQRSHRPARPRSRHRLACWQLGSQDHLHRH